MAAYDPNVTVDGCLAPLAEPRPMSLEEIQAEELKYVHRMDYAGSVCHLGLLTTYCMIPLCGGVMHSIHSLDLLLCWGSLSLNMLSLGANMKLKATGR